MSSLILICLGEGFYPVSGVGTLEEYVFRSILQIGLKKFGTIRNEATVFVTRIEASESFTRLENHPRLRENIARLLEGFPSQKPIDFLLLSEDAYFTRKKMVAFDLDSTLLQCEGIDEFARELGVYEKVAGITERAMRAEIDFIRSFEERVACLEGLTLAQIETVRARTEFTPGSLELLHGIEKFGADSAIFSGGFEPMADLVRKKAKIRFTHTNRLEMRDHACTGRALSPIIDGAMKAALLREHMKDLGLSQNEVLAIGDGSNDIQMLQTAGVGIAYRGKEKLCAAADGALRTTDLHRLLVLLD